MIRNIVSIGAFFMLFAVLFYCSPKNSSQVSVEDVATQLIQNTPQEIVLKTDGTINTETGELEGVNSVSRGSSLLSGDDLAAYHEHASIFDTYSIEVGRNNLYLKFSLPFTAYENAQVHLRNGLANFLAELQRQDVAVPRSVDFTIQIKVRSHELNLLDESDNPVNGFIGIYNILKDTPRIEQLFITQPGSIKPEFILSFKYLNITTDLTFNEHPVNIRAVLIGGDMPERPELRGSSVFTCHSHWFGSHHNCQTHGSSCGENWTCDRFILSCTECRCYSADAAKCK